jgi:Peptidase family M28
MFDAKLVVLDTDFRMFSFRQRGTLPGIDIAHIMDGAAYHTANDNVSRIRRGVIQVPALVQTLISSHPPRCHSGSRKP